MRAQMTTTMFMSIKDYSIEKSTPFIFIGIILNKKIISNAIWMMSEKAISIIGLLLVTSYVAKYVGPSIFGTIALATATFQIIQIVAQLGNDNILFKRISKNRLSGIKLIKSTFLLRTVIYIFISVPTLYYFYILSEQQTFIFFLAVSIACYFSSIDVYAIYYNAILKSRLNTFANSTGLIISLSIQYLIVINQLNALFLSLPIILTSLIPLCIRMYLFPKDKLNKITQPMFIKYNKYILTTGFSIVFSTLSIAIYTRVNQFVIPYIIDEYSLGIYSVAMTLATSWGFILAAIINSSLPSIFSEKNTQKALYIASFLCMVILIISLFAIAFVYFFGEFFIIKLYGDEYINAYQLLIILCISTMISCLGIVSTRFIIKFSGYAFLSKKTLIMIIFSIPSSYLMISKYGLVGAAYSVIILEFISLTIMNYFFKGGIILKLHIETFNIKRLLFLLRNLINKKCSSI